MYRETTCADRLMMTELYDLIHYRNLTHVNEIGVLDLPMQIFPLREMMRSCMCSPHNSKMPTLTYNRAKSVIIKEK
jgi:hypothetical protein